MGRILVTDQPPALTKPQSIVYQDNEYTILRHKETLQNVDLLDLPLHLVLISCGLLRAEVYVPVAGKTNYLGVIKRIRKRFNDTCKAQKAKVEGMPGKIL